MALVLKDRVKETTITIGTSTLVLLGAASGFQSFSVIGDGNTTYYTIDGGTEWEVGIGTYTLLGTTLSRDTILESSNGGTAVNFSAGTKNVFVTYPAEKALYTDASSNAIALGTPASATLTNATGLPISTGVSGLGTGVATFLATPSSANLATAITDETGSGALVFGTSPTIASPTFTSQSTFAAGTAAAPSVTTTGDTNTGMWFPAADTIAFSEGGVESMRIDSSGNVGIGVTPNAWTTSNNTKALQISTLTSVYQAFTGSNFASNTYYNGTNDVYITTAAAGKFAFDAGNNIFTWSSAASGTAGTTIAFTEAMRIDSSGNVGIGTASPSYKVDVVGANGQGIRWTDTLNSVQNYLGSFNSAGLLGTLSNHPLAFYTNNAERMRIDSSGNLLFNSGYGSVATAYGCRAWVNFNGTGTVAIRASGNVSSITDNGTGTYTINFTTAMPNTNYSVGGWCGGSNITGGRSANISQNVGNSTFTTAAVTVFTRDEGGTLDPNTVCVQIFR